MGSWRILDRFRSSLGLLSEIDAGIVGFVVAPHVYRTVLGHVLFDELASFGAYRICHFQLVDGVVAVLQFLHQNKVGELRVGER